MNGKPLRILHVMASHRWTGAAEPTARAAAGQLALGHDVLLALTAGSSFDKKAQELGARTTDAVPFERSYLPWKKWRDLRCLRALIGKFQPDVVHAHLTHDHILAAAALGSRAEVAPILVRTFHREEPVRAGVFQRRWLMHRTAGAMAVSESMRGEMLRAFQWEEKRVLLLGGGIDTKRFAPSDRGALMRERWGIAAGAPVLGIVSRVRIARGHEWLLEAAERALPRVPEARLVICGRGNWQDEMMARLAKHPARGQILYAGYVSGQELEDSYNAFDVALLLRPGNDGTCRAALEAMSCGRPVIGGDIGALHDLLGAKDSGWLVPDNDRDALADAMVRAVTETDERRRRGEKARRLVLEMYSEDLLAPRMIDFYRSLLV